MTTYNGTSVETFALAYLDKPTRQWWFIPTVPEGRKWRGPYRVHSDMLVDLEKELGDSWTVTVTTVRPGHLGHAE